MTRKIISFCPEGDRTERTLALWASTFLTAISGDARYTVDLDGHGTKDRRKYQTKLTATDLALYFGHGNQTVLGHPQDVIGPAEMRRLRGTTIIAMACNAGSVFAHDAVQNWGAAGFLGFDDQLCVDLRNPSVFAAIASDAIRETADPATPASAGLKVLKDGFRAARRTYQKIEKSPQATRRQRYDANQLWLASFANEKTAVWIEP